jgi:GTPase
MHNLPKIVIVGRPKVGKSTLFNRILKRQKAVVEKTGNTTRDRISEVVKYGDKSFELIDTGGMRLDDKEEITLLVEKQIMFAVKEADKIIFVCDVKSGIMPDDYRLSELLRKFDKDIILAVNKADNEVMLKEAYEFYSLGFGEPLAVSSLHGTGIGDLVERVLSGDAAGNPRVYGEARREAALKFAVVGRPNAGKSSFVNTMLGEDRVIVSAKSGTTRDSVDVYFEKQNKSFVIIDTAGIRSKGKIKDSATFFSILRTEESIKQSDAAVILIDGLLSVTKEDYKIIDIVQKKFKPFILAVNKWDLCVKTFNKKEYEKDLRNTIRFMYNAPVLFMSALKSENVLKVLDVVCELAERFKRNFSTELLNRILKGINIKSTRLFSMRQSCNLSPEFEITVRNDEKIPVSDKSHIINVLRRELNLEGVPIRVRFRKKVFKS